MNCTPDPAIQSCDTGQRMPFLTAAGADYRLLTAVN